MKKVSWYEPSRNVIEVDIAHPVVISVLMGFATRPTRLKIRYDRIRLLDYVRHVPFFKREHLRGVKDYSYLRLLDLSWSTRQTMAIARPIRALAFVSLLLCTFVLYQVFSPARGPPKSPGMGVTIDKDPNLDRKCPLNPFNWDFTNF
jgi:hypothetical protein